jgi:hypothetical protein
VAQRRGNVFVEIITKEISIIDPINTFFNNTFVDYRFSISQWSQWSSRQLLYFISGNHRLAFLVTEFINDARIKEKTS